MVNSPNAKFEGIISSPWPRRGTWNGLYSLSSVLLFATELPVQIIDQIARARRKEIPSPGRHAYHTEKERRREGGREV